MKAEVKRFHSPDILDLENFQPDNENSFSFLLQVIVGIKDIESEESFDMIVCTPQWIENNHSESEIIFGEHYLIVFKYDFNEIRKKVSNYIDQLTEENWDLLANKIDRIGKWEFRDYQE